MSATNYDGVIIAVTKDYLDTLDMTAPPDDDTIVSSVIEAVRDRVELENAVQSHKWQIPQRLHPVQVSMIMDKCLDVRYILSAGQETGDENGILAIYQTDGPKAGTYDARFSAIQREILRFYPRSSAKEREEVVAYLSTTCRRVECCTDPDLIAVNNGVFDYRTKTVMPFSPELVFLAKSAVDYNPNAANPIIHNPDDNTDWDVETWMSELSDDPEVVALLWQIIGAVIRPHVRWNKSAWFYSETGNNGKGTLCALMRNLCGPGTSASIALSDFSKDFRLESLIGATSIITDENDVGTFIDKAANIKAVITNDVIQINRKYKTIVNYRFYGFMVQCLNEMPRVKDRSESLYRRQLFVPFDKSFTGKERTYIKADYLNRSEVLEYVMFKVLNMNYYTLSEPEACKRFLQDFKSYNDPVRQFVEEVLPDCVWDFIPTGFLFELYTAWFKQNFPSGTQLGRTTFLRDIVSVISGSPSASAMWSCDSMRSPKRVGAAMQKPEPMTITYGLNQWRNPSYRGADPNLIALPPALGLARGLVRRTQTVTVDEDDE